MKKIILFFVVLLSFNSLCGCNVNKQIENEISILNIFESTSTVYSIVENKNNFYYLTLKDFNPTSHEFEKYNMQFENLTDTKHVIIDKDTFILDRRSNPNKLITIIKLNEILEYEKSMGRLPVIRFDYKLHSNFEDEIYAFIINIIK